ncbi:MAG TPA: outer membrane protein assembly factor BamA [Gaiellaceae bacterium]|nr:outer membrane protein assembly factor BamA [Gaiellaceae bacterium]
MFRPPPHAPALLAGVLAAVFAAAVPATARAQDSAATAAGSDAGRCATPDSVTVTGNSRVSTATILADAGITAGAQLNVRTVQRAIKDLFATGNFDDVRINCAGGDAATPRATLVIAVVERPVLGDVAVVGVDRVSKSSVKDRVDMLIGRPVDPAQVVNSITRIDSLYQANGYYLVRVRPETTLVNGKMKLTFRIDEGRRLAISGVRVNGNRLVKSSQIVGAMKTKPEGFWWFRRGEFDEDKYAGDLGDRIPALYAGLGFVDFQVLKDTVIIDRERGKALVDLTVSEGPRYRIGTFEATGNRRFNTEEITRFYPFTSEGRTLGQRVGSVVRRRPSAPSGVFDRSRWDDATNRVRTAYANEGYIYATVRPVVDRQVVGPDSQHVVNLRWEINEDTPAIINRVDIAGNDYTTEQCIRDQLVILPGDVFNQDRLIRSYQNIGNLNFFETPIPQPDVRPTENGKDVDVIFHVKEKRTGSVNFGASAGQGTGLGGFLGLEQPNFLGQCKKISAQFQYGAYIKDFSVSYTDPAVRQSRVSATTTAYRSQARYRVGQLGLSTRTGGSVQLGFPIPRDPFTRIYASYGLEGVKYGSSGLLGEVEQLYPKSLRSTIGLTGTHDTRIDLPFATAGGMQTLSAQFNGGPLGGNANFQRYTTELRSYAPLGQIGGKKPGSQPIKFVLGLTGRAGAVFGNTGGFFTSQEFALGGVQYGEQLRGYDEFSITPEGYVPGTGTTNASRNSFGSAFFTTTAELGMRFNQMFYLDAFYDAGNIWRRPQDFDPTRLFRGAGIGASVVSPLGPLGLDWAYGFDRTDAAGHPAPKWQLHFKLGQLF